VKNLSKKIRLNSRYRRIYDTPLTPYQRVLNAESFTNGKKEQLRQIYNSIDPITLKRQIHDRLRATYKSYKALFTEPPGTLQHNLW
jgi:hypothetical protein